MSIVASSFTTSNPQIDGRVWVREAHTDHLGEVHVVRYLAPADTDFSAVMANRAPALAESLAQTEALANMAQIARFGKNVVLTYQHGTKDRTIQMAWAVFQGPEDVTAILPGEFLADCTDQELSGALGLSQAQINGLRDPYLAGTASAVAQLRSLRGALHGG